jgi:hypothetical protein
MKKSPKRLALNRETLSRLDEAQALRQVAGGSDYLSCKICWTVPGHSCTEPP